MIYLAASPLPGLPDTGNEFYTEIWSQVQPLIEQFGLAALAVIAFAGVIGLVRSR